MKRTNPVEAAIEAVAAWIEARDEHYSGWNPHDEQYDNGYNGARSSIAATLRSAIGDDPSDDASMLREVISDKLAGGEAHQSDCAIYSAPAYVPEPCTCADTRKDAV